MILVLLFHPSRTAAAALPILVFSVFGRCLPTSVRRLEGSGSRVFYFITSHSLEISWNSRFRCAPHAWTLALRARPRFHIRWRGLRFFVVACPPPFRCLLFDRALSVFSERFFNRLRPKKKISNMLPNFKISARWSCKYKKMLKNAYVFTCKLSFWYSRERARQKFEFFV